ncbi:hypothetical protein [Chitinophaga sp. ARDCPP14]|uniref:hypothetical protein n=1 Tax=Chitinophaga sp. ARDCPP14 TaxID=3391139 RepID=UPI003F51CF48
MNRDQFLKKCLAVGAFVYAPFNLIAQSVKKRIEKGFSVKAGTDRFNKSINLLEGDTFYTKVSSKDTDGDIYVFESIRMKEGPLSISISIRMNGGMF